MGNTCSVEVISSLKSSFYTEALRLIRYCLYSRMIDTSGILPELVPRFFTQPELYISLSFLCQITDGTDSLIQKLLLGNFSQKQQVTGRKGPHFLRNFIREQSVYSVRLLKSDAIFASSLLVEIPTFTVNPSSL